MAGCETCKAWICESCQGIWNHSFSPTRLTSSCLQVMLCLNNCEQLEANLNGWFVFTAAANELTSWKADTVIFSPSCCSLAIFARWIFCCGIIRNFSCTLLTRLQWGRRMLCALAQSYHQLSRVQFSSARVHTGLLQECGAKEYLSWIHSLLLLSNIQKGEVHLLCFGSELTSNSHTDFLTTSFLASERQMEIWTAPLFPPDLAVCPKCSSEWPVTNFCAVQMASPSIQVQQEPGKPVA